MDVSAVKNLKDFLLLFNQISETCFKACMGSFISNDISTGEVQCIELCSDKYINTNYKSLEVFLEIQPAITRKNMEEFEKHQAALEAIQQKSIEGVESTK